MEYTVFYEHADSYSSALFDARCLEDALVHFADSYHQTPVAWATERTISHGGTRSTSDLRKESIAAGRVIGMTTHGWAAVGAEKQDASFRVGGVYRTVGGEIMRLEAFDTFREMAGRLVARAIPISEGTNWTDHAGGRFLDDGRYVHASKTEHFHGDLIPGELTQTASGWVALGAEKQEDELRKVDPTPADVAMTDRDQRPHVAPEPVRFDPFKGFRVGSNHIWQVGEERADHPSPFGIFRNPDCDSGPSDHLNASRHQMAGMKG